MTDIEVPTLAQQKGIFDAGQQRKKQELLTAKKVILRGIDIPFWDLVILIVKIAFAAIPAAIIVTIIWGIIISILGNIL